MRGTCLSCWSHTSTGKEIMYFVLIVFFELVVLFVMMYYKWLVVVKLPFNVNVIKNIVYSIRYDGCSFWGGLWLYPSGRFALLSEKSYWNALV